MTDQPTSDPVFDFLDDDAITVPAIRSRAHPEGKSYRIESPDVDTGLFLTRLQTAAITDQRGGEVSEADQRRMQRFLDALAADPDAVPDDEDGVDSAVQSARLILGDTFDELRADGVSWARVRSITRYAYIAFVNGVEAANEAALSGALSGKASSPAGNRATRRSGQSGRPASTATSRPRAPRRR